MGNPKKQSRFICCKCLTENFIGAGIQRGGKQREKGHVKNLTCLSCGGEITKNVEVRYCDDYLEIMGKAMVLHEEYYGASLSEVDIPEGFVKQKETFMKEKLKDAIYGLAVGDALGVPYEFEDRGAFCCSDMIGYGTHNQPEGTWSDDTSMTLATCASIKKRGCIDLIDIRLQFEKWLFNKEYTPYGEVFDCGNTCYYAIKNKCGENGKWSNGNGSLMRIIPLAFVEGITEEEIMDVSAITHAHEISKSICVKYVKIVRSMLEGKEINKAIADCTSEEFVDNLLHSKEDSMKSGGYVVDSFNSSLWCLLNTGNYADCVLKAVNLGGDTDTTAAIAGGLAGVYYGYNAIPEKWMEVLKRKDIIENCLF